MSSSSSAPSSTVKRIKVPVHPLQWHFMYCLLWLLVKIGYIKRPNDGNRPQDLHKRLPPNFTTKFDCKVQDFDLGLTVQEIEQHGLQQWKSLAITHNSLRPDQIKRSVLFYNSGAYVNPISSLHFGLCAYISQKLQARVIVQPYILAPYSTADRTNKMVMTVYETTHAILKNQGHEVWVAGDSAGGGMAFAVCMALVDRPELMPCHALLMAPWADGFTRDPETPKYAKLDALLTKSRLDQACHSYVTGKPIDHPLPPNFQELPETQDPWVCTLFGGDFAALSQAGLEISILGGTSDLLFPQSQAIAQKCEQHNIPCSFVIVPHGNHPLSVLPFGWPSVFIPDALEAVKIFLQAALAAHTE